MGHNAHFGMLKKRSDPEPTFLMREILQLLTSSNKPRMDNEIAEKVNRYLRMCDEREGPKEHAISASQSRCHCEVEPVERQWNPQASVCNAQGFHRYAKRSISGGMVDIGTWPAFKDRPWHTDPDVLENGLYQKTWWARLDPGSNPFTTILFEEDDERDTE